MKKIFSCGAFLAAAVLSAQTFYIAPDAKADGDGSKAKPFAKIQQGLDKAMPGDTVELAPGVYFEHVNFPRSGKYKKPIRLNGPRTAVIDASERFTPKWEKYPEYGRLAWRTAVPDALFPKSEKNQGCGLVIAKDGLIIQLFERRVTAPKSGTVKIERDTIWEKKHLMLYGIGRTKWKFIKALAMYRAKEKDLIVSFGDGRDVSKEEIILSAPIPAVTIDGVDRCVVSGITIRHAQKGVLIRNSLGSVVENCRILRSDFGVEMRGRAERCTVRFCDISLDPIFRCDPHLMGSWDAWRGHKFGGYWDRIGINILYTTGGHHIHDNHIHNHWGGIQDIGNPGQNLALNVHNNRIDEIEDDGLEPDGGEEYSTWHHNYVTRSRCGCRIKCVRKGPLFAYANVFFDNREDFRNFGTTNLARADVFVYQNTSITPAAINNNAVPKNIGTPNYHYYNNIFVCDQIFAGTYADPNWHDAGNVYLKRRNNPYWKKTMDKVFKSGFKSTSKFLEKGNIFLAAPEKGDFTISKESVAVKAGMDLRKFNLPGIEEFSSQTPDAGALQSGKPMFKVFRSPAEVKHLPAGYWPEPGTKLTLPEHFGKGVLKNR